MKILEEKFVKVFYILTILLFIFFVFYKLDWGSPFFFHPDERNIASAVTQINFPSNFDPHFYAYGSFPIYLTYFLGALQQKSSLVSFDKAIIWGRFLSAILSIGTIFLIYKLTQRLRGNSEAILATILAATSVCYLQFSHFSTFEMWLSFFSLLLILVSVIFLKTQKRIYFLFFSIIFGLLCSLKLSSLVLSVIPIYVTIAHISSVRGNKNKVIEFLKLSAIFIIFSIAAYVITSPYNIISKGNFFSSMHYESGVATGTLPVFYTGSFFGSTPIIFQYTKILPFLINPLLTALSIPAIIFLSLKSLKKKDKYIGLVIITFLVLFLSQSFLFAKWTRYLVPSISFLYIIISCFIFDIRKFLGNFFKPLIVVLVCTGFIFSFSFIKTVRLSDDTRLAALSFAEKNIKPNSMILSEVYDLGITPFNPTFGNITLFNFYDLDNNPSQDSLLNADLKNTDYLVLPSQRVFRSRTINAKTFPQGNKFYSSLFSGKLSYKKIYQTPCDIFCKIIYMDDPVFNVEETANVFDRPTVFIFKRK